MTSATNQRARGLRPIWLFLGCVVFYHLNGRYIAEIDSYVAPYAAWSLATRGTFDVSRFAVATEKAAGATRALPDGRRVSIYPPGSAIAALPLIAPLAMLADEPPKRTAMNRLGKLVAVLYVSGTVVLLQVSVRALAPTAVGAATLLAAAGTLLWSVASQSLWAHGPAAFFVCLAAYLLIVRSPVPSPRGAILAGLALGMAFLIRPTSGLFAGASGVALLASKRAREATCFGIGFGLCAALYVAYNQAWHGNLLVGGYAGSAPAWTTPPWIGIPGLLVAPSRGLLVYSPAFLLVPFGVRRILSSRAGLSAQQRAQLLGSALAAAGTVVLYGRFRDWWGGWCFGPRYLIEVLPILVLVFAFAYQSVLEAWPRWGKRVAWALIALSVLVQSLGVFGHHSGWAERHAAGAGLFDPRDTQIESHARHLLDLVR